MRREARTLVATMPAPPRRAINVRAIWDRLVVVGFALFLGVVMIAWLGFLGWAVGWVVGLW